MRQAQGPAVATALLAMLALAATARAADIARYRNAGATPSMILQSVEVPPNATMLYVSGQLASPIDPAKPFSPSITMADLGDTKTQTISALTKIKGILAGHGFTMSDIIKMTVFVAADPAKGKMDFDGMNAGFRMFFDTSDNPNTVARSAFQVAALAAPAFLVEIEVTAAKVR